MTRFARAIALLRVTTLLVAIGTPALICIAVRARAHTDELLQSAGASMLAYAKATHLDAPRTLVLNGAPLRLLSGSTPDSVDTLLDFFHARCRRISGGLDERVAALQRRLPASSFKTARALDGVLRRDNERAGYLACLDLGDGPIAPRTLFAHIRAFLATGDLAEVGGLRFVWATRDSTRTSYVALFTDGSLPLRSMFPAQGDAPGADPLEIPRPARTRRLLSAWQEGQAPMFASYHSASSPKELEALYRTQLAKQAARVRELESAEGEPRLLWIERGPAIAVAILSGDERGAMLTLVPLRSPGHD
jgi:hypothetical protein